MIRFFIGCIVCIFLSLSVLASNVRLTDPVMTSITNDVITMSFNVNWENSWCDAYNYDAVYIFFKFKLKGNTSEIWNHIYLTDENENQIAVEDASGNGIAYDFWLSPLTTVNLNQNTGIYIYRKKHGSGTSSVNVKVSWMLSKQKKKLVAPQFTDPGVQISANAIEMVYIPRGPFRIGDGYSKNSFYKERFPIKPQEDVLDTSYVFTCSNVNAANPEYVADRVNDNNVASRVWTSSAWVGESGGSPWWLQIDFGEGNEKRITYFAINGAANGANYPVTFKLQAKRNPTDVYNTTLWEGSGKDNWIFAKNAYPGEKAIKIQNPGKYRFYRIYIERMNAGVPAIKTLAMTEKDLEKSVDYSFLIDRPVTVIDSTYALKARDGEAWVTRTIPETMPNGYKGFYVMKYELSQDQYVRFLNKLTYIQQRAILGDVLDAKLDNLNEKEYIFGDPLTATGRNSIRVAMKMKDMPVVFGHNMHHADSTDALDDGKNIASNYMNLYDMLTYADWSGLRPLTELEYEKMCRAPYPASPQREGYAWGTTVIEKLDTIVEGGKATERTNEGNANFGNVLNGPIRVGAFAKNKAHLQESGGSFWGIMDLSGNLSEAYYGISAATNGDLNLTNEAYAHGDGYIDANLGRYDGRSNSNKLWGEVYEHFAVRGGDFTSEDSLLSVSDRSNYTGYFFAMNQRINTLGFRVGHSLPVAEPLESYLTLENGVSTEGNKDALDTVCFNVTSYTITGNIPDTTDACIFLWYMREDVNYNENSKTGKEWVLMEGEHDKDLTYNNFINNTNNYRYYNFKRVVITKNSDSWNYSDSYIVRLMMDKNTGSKLNVTRDTLRVTDTITMKGVADGGFYLTTAEASVYEWKWLRYGYEEVPLTETKTAATTDFASHYVPILSDFKDEEGKYMYGSQLVRVVRMSKALKKCPMEYDMEVYIQKVRKEPILSEEMTLETCGQYMKDSRNQKVYATVLIDSLCWMAENLNFSDKGKIQSIEDAKVYGRYYTWNEANGSKGLIGGRKAGICPKGWFLPANVDWTNLSKFLTSEQGKKMKSSKYWSYSSEGNIGSNESGFNALPAGYTWNSAVATDKHNVARFWTADYYSWQSAWWRPWYYHGWWAQFQYNNNSFIVNAVSSEANMWNTPSALASVRCVKGKGVVK